MPGRDLPERTDAACAAARSGQAKSPPNSNCSRAPASKSRSRRSRSPSTTWCRTKANRASSASTSRRRSGRGQRVRLPRNRDRMGGRLPRVLLHQQHRSVPAAGPRTASSSTARPAASTGRRLVPDPAEPLQRQRRPASSNWKARRARPPAEQPTTPPVPIANCGAVPFAPSVTATASGADRFLLDGQRLAEHPAAPGRDGNQLLDGEERERDAARRHRPQPGHRARARSSAPTAPSRCTRKAPVTCSAGNADRHGRDRSAGAPGGLAEGPGLPRRTEEPRPAVGQEYRIFFNAESARYGVQVRKEGKVKANPTTGQLTAEFNELPQVAFSSATLTFGPTAKHAIPVLSSPPICSQRPRPRPRCRTRPARRPRPPPTELKLTQAPGGGPCAKTLARTAVHAGRHRQAGDREGGHLHALPADRSPATKASRRSKAST